MSLTAFSLKLRRSNRTLRTTVKFSSHALFPFLLLLPELQTHLAMSVAHPPAVGHPRLNQHESPSHSYAIQKVAELGFLLPPGPLSPEDRQDRSKRIHHLLLQCCRTIVRRSDRLRLMFNNIISSVEAKQKDNRYTAILRQWETDFYEQIEVEGSVGWNYLHDDNFELIVKELERCCNNRYQIVRSVSFPHIRTRADSTSRDRSLLRLDEPLTSAPPTLFRRFGRVSATNPAKRIASYLPLQITNDSRFASRFFSTSRCDCNTHSFAVLLRSYLSKYVGSWLSRRWPKLMRHHRDLRRGRRDLSNHGRWTSTSV